MWDPPGPTASLTNLTYSYHLTVTNINTDVVIINTTTTATSYPIELAEPCSRATVTALSSEYTGTSTSTVGCFQGGEC